MASRELLQQPPAALLRGLLLGRTALLGPVRAQHRELAVCYQLQLLWLFRVQHRRGPGAQTLEQGFGIRGPGQHQGGHVQAALLHQLQCFRGGDSGGAGVPHEQQVPGRLLECLQQCLAGRDPGGTHRKAGVAQGVRLLLRAVRRCI